MSTMRWASALSAEADLASAVAEVVAAVERDLGGAPDLALVFATEDLAARSGVLARSLHERWPRATLAGCSAGGVVGTGREIEGPSGLSLTGATLPDVQAMAFHVAPDRLPEQPDPAAWRARMPLPASMTSPNFIVLPDPFSVDGQAMVTGLDAAFPGSVTVGGLASGASKPGDCRLIVGDTVRDRGAVVVALDGAIDVQTVVAQGCRPIGQPLFVTRAQRNLIDELDGKPATHVLQGLFRGLDEEDQQLFRTSLHLGVVMSEGEQVYQHGDFLIRNVLGMDPDRGAVAVGAMVEPGDVVQFHLRDAQTSSDELNALLTAHVEAAGDEAAGALMFSCLGRGEGLYGSPNHDAQAFASRLPQTPLGGFFCNGEIGPVRGRTFLHGYTSAFALFRPA